MDVDMIYFLKQCRHYLNYLVVTFPPFSTTVFSAPFALSNTAFLPVILILPLLHSFDVGEQQQGDGPSLFQHLSRQVTDRVAC